MKSLIILSTQRSGSTMVCDDIAGTFALGRPSEYFIEIINSVFVDCKPRQYVQDLFSKWPQVCSTKNGIVAAKIMSNQLYPIGYSLNYSFEKFSISDSVAFYNFFKNSKFVRVIRKDKVSQAVSRIMANKTEIYHCSDDLEDLSDYVSNVADIRDESNSFIDINLIDEEISKICNEELLLDAFLSEYDLNCHNIFYEDVIHNRNYIADIAQFFGVDNVRLRPRRLKKVSGPVSEKLIEMYKAYKF